MCAMVNHTGYWHTWQPASRSCSAAKCISEHAVLGTRIRWFNRTTICGHMDIYIYICTHKYVHMYMYPTNPHNITIRSSVQVSYCMIIYIYNYMYISIDLYIHIYYIIVYLYIYILLYIYIYHMSRRYGSRSCTIIHRLVIGRVKLTKLSEMKGVPLSLHLNQRNVLRLENIPLIYIYIYHHFGYITITTKPPLNPH